MLSWFYKGNKFYNSLIRGAFSTKYPKSKISADPPYKMWENQSLKLLSLDDEIGFTTSFGI